tara:strand:- start:1333 stop:1641 length:309 start_codon:yes stop_codon:yes gene_type:complete
MSKTKTRTPDRLIGQAILYMGSPDHRKNHIGYRAGRIKSVTRSRNGTITRIVIADNAGDRVRLYPSEWNHDSLCGVQRWKIIRPVDEVDALLEAKSTEEEGA